MSKYKMYQNMQKNTRLFFANTLSFNFDDADVSLLEKNIKISEQLYNDLPFYLKIIAMNYEDMDIKEIILESYDVNDNLELSYQQRLNFILGYFIFNLSVIILQYSLFNFLSS